MTNDIKNTKSNRTNESWESDTKDKFQSPNNKDYSGQTYKAKSRSNMNQTSGIRESKSDSNKKSDHRAL